VLIAFEIPTTVISLWMTTYTCHSHDHSSSLLLLQDASKYSPLSRKSFEILPCSSFRMKNLTVKTSYLSRIRSSQMSMCLAKSFEMPFNFLQILCSLLLLKFLPACIMVNSILLVVFVGTPWLCHFEPNDAMCANARCHQDILLNYLPTQTSSRTWVGSRQFESLSIVQLSLSTYPSLIRASASDHSFGNHNSFVF
jgi:hypothetical protein